MSRYFSRVLIEDLSKQRPAVRWSSAWMSGSCCEGC